VIVVNADRATTANDYVVTTTRKNGATIVGKADIYTNTRDYVVTLAGLEFIEGAGVELIVLTIVRDAYLAHASDFVVTITSIEVARGSETGNIFVSAIVSSASDYVITIAGIEGAGVVDTVTISGTIPFYYVITITGIYRSPVADPQSISGSSPIYYVVTITGINAAYLANAIIRTKRRVFCVVIGARDYVVTLGGIEGAGVENTVVQSAGSTSSSANASDSVVASKSISDRSIEYLLYPRHRDNISLVGKRYT
jgi:hypothetical protein